MDAGEVFHIARKAIERLDDHGVEFAAASGGQKIEETISTKHGAAGSSRVAIAPGDRVSVAPSKVLAERDLIIDRAIILMLGAIPSVNGSSLHLQSPIAESDTR
jgi:hypothetical protein